MNLVLSTLGTLGDILLFLGFGRALLARGHDVTFLANEVFGPRITAAGLRFEAIADADAFRQTFEHGNPWRQQGGVRHAFETHNRPAILPAFEHIRRRRERGEGLVVVAGHNAFGARFASERLGLPLVCVTGAPYWLRPRRRASYPLPWGLPPWLVDLCYWGADRFQLDPQVAPGINACRRQLGLPALRRVYHHWYARADLHLALYPEWFGMPEPDWPANLRMTGFPLPDPDPAPRHEGAAAFIEREGPPLVFTTGTGVADVGPFFAASKKLCAQLDRPGIFLSRQPVPIPPARQANLAWFDYVDLGFLLPRAAALIHHGGAGGCAQAIRAGVPQLNAPLAYDQPDNARRIARLGLGGWISRRRYLRGEGAAALSALLESPSLAARLAHYAQRIVDEPGIPRAVQYLEEAHFSR
jgi:rhamnosyltransferase subunit B